MANNYGILDDGSPYSLSLGVFLSNRYFSKTFGYNFLIYYLCINISNPRYFFFTSKLYCLSWTIYIIIPRIFFIYSIVLLLQLCLWVSKFSSKRQMISLHVLGIQWVKLSNCSCQKANSPLTFYTLIGKKHS